MQKGCALKENIYVFCKMIATLCFLKNLQRYNVYLRLFLMKEWIRKAKNFTKG